MSQPEPLVLADTKIAPTAPPSRLRRDKRPKGDGDKRDGKAPVPGSSVGVSARIKEALGIAVDRLKDFVGPNAAFGRRPKAQDSKAETGTPSGRLKTAAGAEADDRWLVRGHLGPAAGVDGEEGARTPSGRRVVRRPKGGLKSAGVWLTEGQVVEKQYAKEHAARFKMEVDHLRHLSDCPFVPKLVSSNPDTRTLCMTYCGEPLPQTAENERLVHELLTKLRERWGLVRALNYARAWQELGTFGNATTDGKRIYLIDFGSSMWIRVKPSAPAATPQQMPASTHKPQ